MYRFNAAECEFGRVVYIELFPCDGDTRAAGIERTIPYMQSKEKPPRIQLSRIVGN